MTGIKLKRHRGRFSLVPVFVFHSIPLVHGRVSPDINTPQSSTLGEVPACVDKLIVSQLRVFASVLTVFSPKNFPQLHQFFCVTLRPKQNDCCDNSAKFVARLRIDDNVCASTVYFLYVIRRNE